MSGLRIYNAEPKGFSSTARASWESLGSYVEGAIDSPELAAARADAEVLIVRLARSIDAKVLADFPKLRWVISATTGLDHLDLVAIEARAIEVVSLRGETGFLSGIPSTAEHTMALMLSLLRHVPAAVASVRSGQWDRDSFRGRQLKDRRLGIVGLGRTGRMVAQYATAFGAQVAYFDPGVTDSAWEKRDTLDLLLRDSEILSLHIHLDDATRGLIGPHAMDQLPVGAYLINTSRGAIIDEEALVERLKSHRLGGAAVDVISGELQDIQKSPLWRAMIDGLPVIVTPHVGGATLDAMQQCEEFIVAKFRNLALGAHD